MSEEFKIGFTAGVFDLTHCGHLLMFQYCKKHCDYLIVAIQVDPSKYREGKEAPIETIFERFVRLESCKYVDKVIPYESEEDLESILNTVYYDLRFIGSDHQGRSFTGDSIRKDTHHFNPRDHQYSSTSLKERVVSGRKSSYRPKPEPKVENVGTEEDEHPLMRSEEKTALKLRKERKKRK